MQQTSWSRLIAAIGFLVACAVGVLTNIITESFSWTVSVALGVLVVVGMILAGLQVAGRSARVEQRIGWRARLADSPTVAAGDATVDDRISGRGDVERSGIDVETGKVTRRVRGKVAGSGITIKK
ncbi:hypothetical protein [Micromonospora chalcea]|uniref:hypothetical protein n=1 Tax=Micromonospora chalcea TaxID=1874 RepID=UPI00332DC7FF